MTDNRLRQKAVTLLKSAVLAAVVMTVCALPLFAAPADSHNRAEGSVPRSGKELLSVVGDHAYPPYEFVKDGCPTGFNIDLIKTVAEVMGLEIRIELGPWSEVRDKLETGQAELLNNVRRVIDAAS